MSTLPSTLPLPDHVPAELVIDFDITNDRGMEADAFKRLSALRDASPRLAYTPRNGGHWIAFDGADVETVLTDAERFTSTQFSRTSVEAGGPPMIPLGMDPPEHLPYRMMLLRYLGPKQIKRLAEVVRAKADMLIRPLVQQRTCDFVPTVAEQMPISIFMELMGLPAEGFQEFRDLAVLITSPSSHGDLEKMGAANQRIMQILSELIAARTAEPKEDLVSALLSEQVGGRPLDGMEMMSICYVLFLGGLDTVTNAMAFGIRYLALDPELQAQVRQDRTLIPTVAERLLRQSAFVNPQREVVRDTELAGVRLKAGDLVWNLTWPASNAPGESADGPRHFAFGFGHHMCAGMHLARLELTAMYESWFEHIGRFRLADDGPAMSGGPVMHLKRLLLEIEPASA